MGTMQKKFNILGIALTLVVAMGLLAQYLYLNNAIGQEKQSNMIERREHLAEDINAGFAEHNQSINMMAEIIGDDKWTYLELEKYMNSLVAGDKITSIMYFGDMNNRLINNKKILFTNRSF